MDSRPSPLARYLFAAYLLLVIYASLHPFYGWRDQGVALFDFLRAPLLPRYYTAFDLTVNVLAYAPLGALAVAAAHPRLRGAGAWFAATLIACVLSLGLESAQAYLPARIPSGLDWALNTLGAALGATAGLFLARRLMRGGGLRELRHRLFTPGRRGDLGLVLLGIWLLTQLNPETLLFGNGDLRGLFQTTPKLLYPAATFIRVEALVSAAQIVAIALLLSLLVVDGGPKRRIFLLVLLSACAVRSLAFALLFDGHSAWDWLTPGALWGLGVGVIAASGALMLSRQASVALCGLLLMAATALVNLAPDNPYLLNSLQEWRQGHFLNFNGLTRLLSIFWPFALLAYLLSGGVRNRHNPT